MQVELPWDLEIDNSVPQPEATIVQAVAQLLQHQAEVEGASCHIMIKSFGAFDGGT